MPTSSRAVTATAHIDEAADRDPIRALRLSVIDGPDAGRVHRSTSDHVVLGSHETADFVLTDPTVSRFHAELHLGADGVSLRDLGSRNGTRVDKLRIGSVRVDGTLLLQLGETRMRLEVLFEQAQAPPDTGEQFGPMVGTSEVMRATFNTLERAASLRANLLIEGEAGTGKRLAASAIHAAGPRADGPIRFVDCSRPEATVHRDLFGEGSEPRGALARSRGGTLVLRDLGSLTPALQHALWRLLERDATDVRVIATTRRPLFADVNAGRMRTDLYGLVASLRIRIPPLRQRASDIPILIRHLVRELGGEGSQAATQLLSERSCSQLSERVWPNNVRELRAHVGRCIALGEALPLEDSDAGSDLPRIDPAVPIRDARTSWVRYFERRYLTDLLESTDQNVSAAARIAGVDRVHMHRLLKAHGLR